MSKSISVRIRKAGEGEQPGFYNKNQVKTANFLKKAQVGMQVGSGNMDENERIKVILSNAYAAIRDGMQPDLVFESLVTKYALSQEVAYQVVNTVMTKLAEQGFVDPAYLNDEDEESAGQNKQQPAQEQPAAAAQQEVATPDEDEELAMSMLDEGSAYDSMDHMYGDAGTEEMQQEGAFMYGGYYDQGGEYADYQNYFEDQPAAEETIINQYSNPGQLSDAQKEPFSLEKLIKFTPGATEYPQAPDLSYYLGNYSGVADLDIPTELLPMSSYRFGGQTDLPKAALGKPIKGKRKKKTKTEKETTTTETTVTPEPSIRVTPQEAVVSPTMGQSFLNRYRSRNPISNRGALGTAAEVVGTGFNFIRPQNWKASWREQVAPSTTGTQALIDLNNLIKDPNYEPVVLEKNTDGTVSSGTNFSLTPDISKSILDLATGTELKAGKSIEVALPKSSTPELDFLSLHTQGTESRLKLTRDASGLLKAEITTNVPTKLKGYSKTGLTVKDEVIYDPIKKEFINPMTGTPLESFTKSYYTGNQLNWYNAPYTFPFTSKYPNLNLEAYPKIVSAEPLAMQPKSGWNVARNLLGLPLVASPGILPFSYPGFAARSKFYPKATKVEADFLGKSIGTGTEGSTGTTFGEQSFEQQYNDYNLLRDRNFKVGKNILKGTGILGSLALLNYGLSDDPAKEALMDDANYTGFGNKSLDYIGAGRSYDTLRFGLDVPIFDKDSMFVKPTGDTIFNRFYQAPMEDYKKGGALKKKFIKRVTSMFAPGGETEETSGIGKGNRMDTNTSEVSKRKTSFIDKLKTQSDKAATEELYEKVQQTGDPNLMNIFMGQGQNSNQNMQQPMSNNMMAEGGSMDPCPEGMVYDPIYGCIPAADKNMKEYSPEQINEYFEGWSKSARPFGEIEDNISPDYWNQPKSNFFRKMMDDNKVPYIETNPGQYTIPYDQLTPKQKTQLWYLNEGYTEKKLDILNQMGIPPNEWMDYIQKMELQEDANPFPSTRENQQYRDLYREMDDEYEYNLKDCDCRKRQIVNNEVKEICVPCEEQGYTQQGGFINMSASNPLTRFIYGGDDNQYYEPYNVPEAREGITIKNKAGESRGVADKLSYDDWAEGERADWEAANPGGDFDAWKNDAATQEQYDQYQNFYDKSLNDYYNYGEMTPDMMSQLQSVFGGKAASNNTMVCGPGMMWSPTYKQCIPVGQVKLNPRIVRGAPGLASTLLPWNPLIRKGSYYKTGNPFTLKDLQRYTGQLGQPIATLKTRKNWFSPKTELDIYNPDGVWSQADLEQLMEYQGGKGKKSKSDKEGKETKGSRKAERTEDIPRGYFSKTGTDKTGQDVGVNKKGQLVSRPNPMEGAPTPIGTDEDGNTIYGQYGKRDHLRNQLWLNDKTMKDYRKEGPSIFGNTMFGDQEEMAEKYSKKGALGKARMRNQFNKTGLWKLPLNKKK